MTIVLFEIATGLKIDEYATEDTARKSLREVNGCAGWTRLGTGWCDGVEREFAVHSNGLEDYAPYGITELERWEDRFRPEFIKQRKEFYGTQEDTAYMV